MALLPTHRKSQCELFDDDDTLTDITQDIGVVISPPAPLRGLHCCDGESSDSRVTPALRSARGRTVFRPGTVSPTPGLRQARRKRLECRLGQDGTLYQEGRRQTDHWLPDKPAYLRIFLDIPGQSERVKHNEPLGKCSTREEARRKADRWIMTNGINDREKLESAVQPSEAIFRSQAAWWLSELGSGRLKSRQKNKRGQKIRTTTLDAYTSAVAYLNEKIGDRTLASFDNAEMKELVFTMEAETKENGEQRLTPKTIVNYYLIAAAVFATAKDRKGKQLFPRQWDLNYIGLPAINKKAQKTPTFEAAEIETILVGAKELYRVLYCLLAGSGLRIAEATGLEVGKHFSNDCSIVHVRQQRSKKGHKIEAYPKTDAGIRDIDLHPDLAVLVKEYIGSRRNGFLFETSGGLPMSPRNILRDSLHPILKEMGRESAGFHTFRRFRESILQMSEARSLLIDYWMGHANGEMSGRYGKQLLDNVQWRQECAAKVGLGFVLPTNKQPMIDKSGQVLRVEEHEAVTV
jgi:integrase